MNPGSFEFSLLESLKSPRVESMNGEEHCNCLYFSHGYYPNHDAKGNVLEVTLDCYADVQNPNYFNIIPMDVLSKKMSADNTITKKIFNRINSESKHRFSYQTLKLIAWTLISLRLFSFSSIWRIYLSIKISNFEIYEVNLENGIVDIWLRLLSTNYHKLHSYSWFKYYK